MTVGKGNERARRRTGIKYGRPSRISEGGREKL
jgi:hypothetical protein